MLRVAEEGGASAMVESQTVLLGGRQWVLGESGRYPKDPEAVYTLTRIGCSTLQGSYW